MLLACDICGRTDEGVPEHERLMTRAALTASARLASLPPPGLQWLSDTYGLVPSVTCAACFIPALSGANAAWAATQPVGQEV